MQSLYRSTEYHVGFQQARDELAALSFIDKFINCGYNTSVSLNVCALQEALYGLYLRENKQKILILYFHNQSTEFSRQFCSFLSNRDARDTLDRYFTILGWDVGEDEYQEILIDTLSSAVVLQPCIEMLRRKEPAVIFISLVDMDFEICSIMKFLTNFYDFNMTLENLIACFCRSSEDELGSSIRNSVDEDNNCSYVEFQQRMYNELGSRDYDNFDANELSNLKDKICFALFGMPVEESGYTDRQKDEANKMYEVILEANNEYSEYENQVVMAVVYTCLVPLESKDSKLIYTPVPVFILRKCREAEYPCRVIVDHTRRVYNSWNGYLEDNKFCKCIMVVPEDGCYAGDENGNVKLKTLESPACTIGQKVLRATDISSTVLGLGSTGVMVAAAVPAITVAPFALLGAAAVGAGVGVYAIGRSVCTLVDRGRHKESLNVTDSEARGAYLNIAAGAAGFVGAGANAAVSQLAANGVTIGTTARIAVNTISVANIGIGGLAVGNSAVEIFVRWWVDDETPSALTVLQLSTSIFFFGHAVYNFRTAGAIIEESQANVLKDYNESLRSNRHRKTFKKLELETIRMNNGDSQRGRAEVISTIRNIKNKDDVFAFLTRSNRKFNELGIRFAANDGQVVLNGITLDLAEVSSISRSDIYSYFAELPRRNNTSIDSHPSSINFDYGRFLNIETASSVTRLISQLVGPQSIQQKIRYILREIFNYFHSPNVTNIGYINLMNEMFPNGTKYLQCVKMLLSFIQNEVGTLQRQYERHELEESHSFLYRFLADVDGIKKKILFLQIVCDGLLLAFQSPSRSVDYFLSYCTDYMVSAFMEQEEINQRNIFVESGNRRERRICCSRCSGYYFQ